jgi:hypothetical protein
MFKSIISSINILKYLLAVPIIISYIISFYLIRNRKNKYLNFLNCYLNDIIYLIFDLIK